MQEEIDFYLASAEESMQESIAHLQRELIKIRSGKASPDMVNGIRVDYYGSLTPLAQVANVKTSDARTIVIAPWEKNMIQPIETAIKLANIGIMPQNDGQVIRLNIPPLTEERRKQLVKQSHTFAEQAKVSIRNARREAIEEIKKAVKNGYPEDLGKRSEDQVQSLTDKHIAQVDQVLEQKEKDIMTV
jgi:ribosome recycling factor